MTFPFPAFRLWTTALLLLFPLLPSCSTSYWSSNADQEVYGILQSNEVKLFGKKTSFEITTPHSADDPKEIEAINILAERKTKETLKIDLPEAIDISVDTSREYQTEKENLYLVGMDLTRARHDFAPQFDASTGVGVDNTWVDGHRTKSQTNVPTRIGFSKMLRSGGSLALDLAHNIFKFYIGNGIAPSRTSSPLASINRYFAELVRSPPSPSPSVSAMSSMQFVRSPAFRSAMPSTSPATTTGSSRKRTG